MGATALFIFYSPFTSPSGSHINPAVTATFLRLGRICPWDALFYTLFQCLGGIGAVYLMAILLGHSLTDPPVHYAVTIPGKYGQAPAAILEFLIAFLTMTMVLFTTEHAQWKKYTRVLAASLVCIYVIVAGPVSGFGMNPARSLASALPAHQWTSFWIYGIIPFAGMLTASECFLWVKKKWGLKSGKAVINPLH
jgi:aquaporin Z